MELAIVFFGLMFSVFFIFFYYAKRDNKRDKITYVDVQDEDENKEEKEIPIIRY